MPIIPKICITTESDATKIYVKDETKAYVLSTNEGGYGAPNDDRNLYAGVLSVYYQPYEGDKVLLTSFNSSYIDYSAANTNSHESSFELNYYKDGWYEYYYTLVPTSTTPAENTIIYDTVSNSLKQYDAGLTLVTPFDYSVLENTLLYQIGSDISLATAKLTTTLNTLIMKMFSCKQCIDCGCDDELKAANLLKNLIEGIKNQFNISRYEAQRVVEKLTKQYKIT